MSIPLHQTFFVGISGGTGSGKSTLVRRIVEHLTPERVSAICLDSYYRDQSHLTEEIRARQNYDSPESLDLVLLYNHLRELQAGNAIDVPIYDFAHHNRSSKRERIEVRPVILLDGILALHDPEVRNLLSLKIFLDIDAGTRFERRLSRDTHERGRTEDSVHWQWKTTVQPMYLEYCEPSRRHADVILNAGDDWSGILQRLAQTVRAI